MIESIEKLREFVDDQFVYSGQAYLQGMAIAGSIEREIAERYMLLPCDADGVPVRIGDKMTNINKPSDEYTVAGVSGERLFVYGGYAHICASQCRHVNPRTIEDVLADFAAEVENDRNTIETARRYAEEIRELRKMAAVMSDRGSAIGLDYGMGRGLVDAARMMREAADTIEVLRKLLDERGVKWWETINHANCIFTWWESPKFGIVQAMDNEDGETLFMACLNDCNFTPEQAISATVGSGTLTAEQVRETVEKHWHDLSADYDMPEATALPEYSYDWQAIADELNALAERTCECVEEYAESPFDGKTIVLHRCSACHELMRPHMRYCPNCGCKVVDA